MPEVRINSARPNEINIVRNWFEELKGRVPFPDFWVQVLLNSLVGS